MKGCPTKGHLQARRPDREAIVQMYNQYNYALGRVLYKTERTEI